MSNIYEYITSGCKDTICYITRSWIGSYSITYFDTISSTGSRVSHHLSSSCQNMTDDEVRALRAAGFVVLDYYQLPIEAFKEVAKDSEYYMMLSHRNV